MMRAVQTKKCCNSDKTQRCSAIEYLGTSVFRLSPKTSQQSMYHNSMYRNPPTQSTCITIQLRSRSHSRVAPHMLPSQSSHSAPHMLLSQSFSCLAKTRDNGADRLCTLHPDKPVTISNSRFPTLQRTPASGNVCPFTVYRQACPSCMRRACVTECVPGARVAREGSM